MDEQRGVHEGSIEPGELVYDSDNRPVGRVSGLTEGGFEAETILQDPDMEEIPGKAFGGGYLMWRCAECGKMSEIANGLPAKCPDCGAPREAISAIEED